MSFTQTIPAQAAPSSKSIWPISFIKLHKEIHLDWFKNEFTRAIEARGGHTDVDLDYLKQCFVFVFFIGPKAVGGFCINAKEKRYLKPFSQKQLDELEKEKGIRFADSVEITCIWSNIPKDKPIPRNFFFAYSLWKAILTGKRFIIGGATNLATLGIYKLVLCRDLFQGQLADSNGEKFDSYLCFNSRFSTILQALKCLVKRETRPKKE